MPTNKRGSPKNPLIAETRGCLLYQGNIEAKPKPTSLGKVEPAWKAGTLPTELLPHT